MKIQAKNYLRGKKNITVNDKSLLTAMITYHGRKIVAKIV